MEAKELRIGNLCVRTNKLTNEMLELELTGTCILDISANGVTSSFVYEPIQLTEEWLLKFGFKYDLESKIYKTASFKWLGFYHHTKSGCELVLDHVQYKTIDHVHQLQNLYFALTGQELTIKQ